MNDQIILLAGLALVLLLLIIIFSLLLKRRRAKAPEALDEYIAGLNLLIAGEKEKALDRLRQTVRINTNFIDAYVKIGDILREMGSADRAVKIHRDLLVRSNLSIEQNISILKSLAQDYYKEKKYQQVISVCDEIFKRDRDNKWAVDLLLNVHEETGDWNAAFDLLKKSEKLDKKSKAVRLANYKVEHGIQLTKQAREHDGRVAFRDAIRLDPHCGSAHLELAESYIREERYKDALTALKKLLQTIPQHADLAFNRLQQVLFDMGNFGEIENLYIELLKENPEIVAAHIGLAEIYVKKGELRRAAKSCEAALEQRPSSLTAKLMLIKIKNQLGQTESANEIATELASSLLADREQYVCKQCYYHQKTYFWHCPRCKSWNSAEKSE